MRKILVFILMLSASMSGEAGVHFVVNVDFVRKAEADELVVHSNARTIVSSAGESRDTATSHTQINVERVSYIGLVGSVYSGCTRKRM